MSRWLKRRVNGRSPQPRVVISIPAQDQLWSEFHSSTTRLMLASLRAGLVVGHQMARYALVHYSREYLARKALEHGWTHALFLDSDVLVPADAIARLLANRRPIVGANYPRRFPPHTMTAVREDGTELATPGAGGLERVRWLGAGCMLVDCDVFRTVKPPWFDTVWLPSGEILSEDCYFAAKAAESGFHSFVDQELSAQVRHVGSMAYGPAHRSAYDTASAAPSETHEMPMGETA